MKVFVTGGSGFIGRNLITILCARGAHVRALARSERAAKTVESLGAEPVHGDLHDDEALRTGMTGCDWVFHAAAKVELWGTLADFHQVNVTGTEQVLATARQTGVSRLVYVSSGAVVVDGRPMVNADETRPRPAKPMDLYALTKGLGEDRVLAANSPEMATMVVRLPFVWGKGDTSILPLLMDAVKTGQFKWIDEGSTLTSTCHVTNTCEGMILMAERGRGGEIYNLTDGDPVVGRRFLTDLLATQGLDPGSSNTPLWAAQTIATLAEGAWRLFRLNGAPPITRLQVSIFGVEATMSDTKARQELGYQGQITIEAGLAEMQREKVMG